MACLVVVLLVTSFINSIAPSPTASMQHGNDYNQIGHTKYSIKTVQSGTSYYPNDGGSYRVKVRPEPTQSKSYLTITETKLAPVAKPYPKNWQRLRHQSQRQLPTTPCIRCPPDRTLIAQKRLDGVLMLEMPSVMSCSSRNPFSKSLYEIQTLFGAHTEFVLPAGSHSIMAHIVNVQTGKEEKACTLRLHVLVRRCEPYRVHSNQLKVKCDRDNIWGSKCTFSCGKAGKLTHGGSVVCDDDLHWSGSEPECVSFSNQRRDFCVLPPAPENGKFSCEINDNQTIDENALGISDGSRCQVVCDPGYVPAHNLQDFSWFYCANGHWNSTMYDFCHRKHY